MELLNLSFLAFLVKSLTIETSSLLSQTPSFYCRNTNPPLLFRTWSTSPKIISSWISFEIEVIPWTLYILGSRLRMWTSLTSYYSAFTSIDICIDKTNLTRKMVIGSQGEVLNICICGKCDLSIALRTDNHWRTELHHHQLLPKLFLCQKKFARWRFCQETRIPPNCALLQIL
jgi:hypothetical protein